MWGVAFRLALHRPWKKIITQNGMMQNKKKRHGKGADTQQISQDGLGWLAGPLPWDAELLLLLRAAGAAVLARARSHTLTYIHTRWLLVDELHGRMLIISSIDLSSRKYVFWRRGSRDGGGNGNA